MMKSFLYRIPVVLFFLIAFNTMAQEENKSNGIKWMSFEQAVAMSNANPKKIFIDVYTKWCGWCKRMDASTYSDASVIDYMNKNFYAVKLDAETHDTIHFADKAFVYRDDARANEIAISLLNQHMSYPTSVYLDEKFALLGPAPGYQTAEQLLPQLKFFAEEIYKTKSWDDYRKEVFGQ
jgi:thioredoxin-related protein